MLHEYAACSPRPTLTSCPSRFLPHTCACVLVHSSGFDRRAVAGLLDHDCDGQISEADYVHAITHGPAAAIASLRTMDERWQQAAVALEG